MIKNKIIALLLLGCLNGGSQTPKIALPELGWAILHPIAAIKVKCITKKCNRDLRVYKVDHKEVLLDKYSNGGQEDAFRHVFFMAAYAQKIKVRKLRKLGNAHEKTNYRQFLKSKLEDGEQPDSLGSVMDIENNELGFKIGRVNKYLKRKDLIEVVINKIKVGQATIMKRDSAGNYLDCDGKKIDLTRYQKKWSVPKCLVSSD